MDMHLQPLATTCFVSGQPFAEGDRVASFLVRSASLEIVRYDVLEASVASFTPAGYVACRWGHRFKPRSHTDGDAARALKLSAENLFLTLADPTNELNPESTRLVQFLALMLERKKVIRAKGLTPDATKQLFEHARTKQIIEVPAGELTPEFFVAVQEQLSVLVGAPKPKVTPTATPEPAPAAG